MLAIEGRHRALARMRHPGRYPDDGEQRQQMHASSTRRDLRVQDEASMPQAYRPKDGDPPHSPSAYQGLTEIAAIPTLLAHRGETNDRRRCHR